MSMDNEPSKLEAFAGLLVALGTAGICVVVFAFLVDVCG
jgi:hypothetical protein